MLIIATWDEAVLLGLGMDLQSFFITVPTTQKLTDTVELTSSVAYTVLNVRFVNRYATQFSRNDATFMTIESKESCQMTNDLNFLSAKLVVC